MMKEGVNGTDITVLTLYEEQRRLISQQLNSAKAKVQAYELWVLFEYMDS
jgi:superfamily I DNA and/or RNA helicase